MNMKAKKDQQRWKTCGDIIAEYEFNIKTLTQKNLIYSSVKSKSYDKQFLVLSNCIYV